MKDLNFNEVVSGKIERIIDRLKNLKLKFSERNDDDYFNDILVALLSNFFPTLSYIESIINPADPEITKEDLRRRLFENWEFLYLGLSQKQFIFSSKNDKQIILQYYNNNQIDSFIKSLNTKIKNLENNSFFKSDPFEIERIVLKLMQKKQITGLESFFEFE